MKKQSGLLRRSIILALLLLCILAALTVVSFAADIVASGYCGGEGDGTNLSWTLDAEGTLTIRGTGKMGNHGSWERSKVKNVTIESGVTNICADVFKGCTSLYSIAIPTSVTSIGEFAFAGCESLVSITIPYGVDSIERFTFAGCESLKDIIIPDSVTSIGRGAFEACYSLTGINLPDCLDSIGEYAFSGCHFTTVTIPASVRSIGEGAFHGCGNASNIRVITGNTVYDSRDNCNAIIETQTNTLILGCKNTVIPNTIERIGSFAFSTADLVNITIPGNVKTIGRYAFYTCEKLIWVTINSGATSIGEGAFSNCSNLTSIMFLGNVDSIGDFAFSSCNRLEDAFFCGDAPKAEMVTDNLFAGVNKDIFKIHYTSGKAGWTDNPNIYFEKEGTWHGYKLVLWDGQFVQFRQATPQSVTIQVQNKEEAYVYAAIYENGRFIKTVCKLVPVNAGEVTLALGMDKLPEGAVIKAFVLAADGKTPLAKNAVWTVR